MEWQQLAPIVGGTIAGLCTLFAAWRINSFLSREIKSKEFVFQFTQRYHDVLGTKHRLNHPQPNERVTTEDAYEMYRRLFGLVFDEFYAYQHGFLDAGIFTEWMKWRRDDYQGDKYRFEVCGVTYREGWELWGPTGPFGQANFSLFLDEIHNAPSYDDVERIVRENAPGFFGSAASRQTMLRRTRFLSRLIGLLTVVVAVAMLRDREGTIMIANTVLQSRALLLTVGLGGTLAGLAIMLGHNVWTGVVPFIVSLIGLIMLACGLVLLWAPAGWVAGLFEQWRPAEWFYWYAGGLLAVGLVLTIAGFWRRPGPPVAPAAVPAQAPPPAAPPAGPVETA